MAYTIQYFEIRESTDVKFWHETEDIKLWFDDFQQQLADKGFPNVQTYSDDKLMYTKVAVFEDREQYENILLLSPVREFQDLRQAYNQEHGIVSFATDEYD